MSTSILGISAFYHDSAACLVRDGKIIAAAQEERFSRLKHDSRFPRLAVEFCLRQAGISAKELDHVAFYEKPLLKFERLLETYFAFAPWGFRSFFKAIPVWMKQKLHLPRELDRGLAGAYKGRYLFPEHHECHAASAFFPSPFQEAAVLTIDGVGEWTTTSYGIGRGNRIELTHEICFPHSLGLLYSAFTYFCGFKVNSGEYKLMGLAPYGVPRFRDAILRNIIDLKDDGSFRLDLSWFNYCQGLTMTAPKLNRLLEGPPRRAGQSLTQREMDIAASIQQVTEEAMLRCARHVARQTGMKNLVLAGGVALNCVGNGRILKEGIFDQVWIQPAAGDAGGALGAALLVWHQLLGKPRPVDHCSDLQCGSLLGPAFTTVQVCEELDRIGAKYERFQDEAQLLSVVAAHIAAGKVVGWMQGRMEFGPRALGSRSILGDARDPQMQSVMNLKIKFRESFRPFAPAVLREQAHEWFDLTPDQQSPYMLLVAPVHPSRILHAEGGNGQSGGAGRLLEVVRSTIPSVTHVDYSARVQTVDPLRHGRFYRLLKEFHRQTGCPVMINTSFNVRSEPIVCTPEDAYRCFMATHMDILVIEDCLLEKQHQPEALRPRTDQYLASFEPD